MTKLAIQGSRTLCDDRVRAILLDEIDKYEVTEIITSGETNGVCKVARDLCREMGIPLRLNFLNFSKYARGAFEHRSIETLNEADMVIFIHDGQSKGTINEIELAKKKSIPYSYHLLERIQEQDMIFNVSMAY